MINSKKQGLYVLLWSLILLIFSQSANARALRIISANGTLSEIVVGLGLESQLVGVDVTSTYPASLAKVPKIGHNRAISSEGILALKPDIFLYTDQSNVLPVVIKQLKQAGIKVVEFKQVYTVDGARKLIQDVGKCFAKTKEATAMVKSLDNDLKKVKKTAQKKKLLFIYARGTGTLMVGGKETAIDKLFELSGNVNAASGFTQFKPLTTEALVLANPDVMVLFDTGLESLEGNKGLLKVPGVAATNAGKNNKIVTMDGLLLMGFGPRLGKAALELAQKVK